MLLRCFEVPLAVAVAVGEVAGDLLVIFKKRRTETIVGRRNQTKTIKLLFPSSPPSPSLFHSQCSRLLPLLLLSLLFEDRAVKASTVTFPPRQPLELSPVKIIINNYTSSQNPMSTDSSSSTQMKKLNLKNHHGTLPRDRHLLLPPQSRNQRRDIRIK